MTGDGRQRIDRWLFFARAAKSRSLAARLVQAGKVRVNRDKIDQAAHPVKPGDVLTVTLERRVRVLKVLDPGTRRGPASEAQTLYEELSAAAPAPGKTRAGAPHREPGRGRPTKKERRALDRVRDQD